MVHLLRFTVTVPYCKIKCESKKTNFFLGEICGRQFSTSFQNTISHLWRLAITEKRPSPLTDRRRTGGCVASVFAKKDLQYPGNSRPEQQRRTFFFRRNSCPVQFCRQRMIPHFPPGKQLAAEPVFREDPAVNEDSAPLPHDPAGPESMIQQMLEPFLCKTADRQRAQIEAVEGQSGPQSFSISGSLKSRISSLLPVLICPGKRNRARTICSGITFFPQNRVRRPRKTDWAKRPDGNGSDRCGRCIRSGRRVRR